MTGTMTKTETIEWCTQYQAIGRMLEHAAAESLGWQNQETQGFVRGSETAARLASELKDTQ